jgi:hypothetical protein
MFVFSPLQAMGIFAFQGFLVATLLAILAGMLIISDHPAAFAVMSICLGANVVVFLLRLFYPPWHYNIYILAAAWFAIAITLGAVVAQAVFRRGRITYHRIIGAILLYLLIRCVQGNNIRRQSSPCQLGHLFEFCHSDVDGIRRHCSRASVCAEPMQYRKCNWSTLSGHVIGEACNTRNERAGQRLMAIGA